MYLPNGRLSCDSIEMDNEWGRERSRPALFGCFLTAASLRMVLRNGSAVLRSCYVKYT